MTKFLDYSCVKLNNCSGDIYYGMMPDEKTLKELLEKKVTLIWNVAAELQDVLKLEQEMFINVINTKIKDFSIPYSTEKFLEDVEKVVTYLMSGHNIFVHCLGGHGRTGIALASLLIKIENLSAEEALMETKTLCHGPENLMQKDFIRNIYNARMR